MAFPRVVDDGEVLLDNVRYKLQDAGPLRVVSVRQMPEKMVQGDSTRADQRLASEWVISDTSGGLGIDESNDSAMDRIWWGTCNTDIKGSITTNLAPSAISCIVSTAATGALNVQHVGAHRDTILVAGTPIATGGVVDLYTFDTATELLTAVGMAASMATTAVVTDMVEFGAFTFVACGDRFMMYAATGARSSMDVEVATGASRALTVDDYRRAKYFVVAGDQLYKFSEGTNANYLMVLDNSKNILTDTDLWVDGLTMPKHYTVTGLSVFVDNANAPAIFVGTTEGALILDRTNWMLNDTPLQFPPSVRNGNRPLAYDGLYWFPENLSVHRYQPGSIQNMGLDRDDGLPADYRGWITHLAPSPYHVYACVRKSVVDNGYGADGPIFADISGDDSQILGAQVDGSMLFFYNSVGWHVRYIDSDGAFFANAMYMIVNEVPYLWLGTTKNLLRFRLPSGTKRLSDDTSLTFNQSDTVVTPDYTAGFSEIDKNAMVLKVRTRSPLNAGDQIKVEYVLNGAEGTRILLGVCDNTNYLVGDPMGWELPFDKDAGGVAFKSIRLYVTETNGSVTVPVDLKFMVLRFERILPPLYSYAFRLDISAPYKGLSVAAQVEALEDTADKTTTVNFAWRSAGEREERLVRITQMQCQTETGYRPQGIYEITVSEITHYGTAINA